MSLTKIEKVEYMIINNPVLWASHFFNWTSRDYQVQILQIAKNSKQLVLRLGRRLGKTEMMCILLLWYAFVQINKINKNERKYNILIICPFDTQVDLIFDRLNQLIESSTDYKNAVKRNIHHRIELTNGTIIKGMTAGSKSNSGAANTRGQRAEVVVMDEVDYMGDSEITNILNLRNEAPDKVRFICASTPSGRRASYYNWCTKASVSYKAKIDENDLKKRVSYTVRKRSTGGNGWIHFHAPSTVNRDLLKINDDTGITYIEQFKNELTEQRFAQEVMAEFGEEAGGVFNHKYLDQCFELGAKINLKYYNQMSHQERENWKAENLLNKKILGIDWDKVCAGPTFVGIQLNVKTNLFEVFYRRELPRTQFTYLQAVEEAIKLDQDLEFDWIYCDRGAGEVQYEMFKKYGKHHPESGMQHKVIANQLSENVALIDPITSKKTKMPIKPTMINNCALIVEQVKIALNPLDTKLKEQFEDYRVKYISKSGVPVYEDGNDHIIDACSRALLGFAKQYDALFKQFLNTNIRSIGILDPSLTEITRNKVSDSVKKSKIRSNVNINLIKADKMPSEINVNPYDRTETFKRKSQRISMPRRSKF